MRKLATITTFAAAVLLAGCGGAQQAEPGASPADPVETVTQTVPGDDASAPSETTGTEPSAGAGPTASFTPSASATATESASEAASSDQLSLEGYGPYRIGASASQAVEDGLLTDESVEMCVVYRVAGDYANEPILVDTAGSDEISQVTINEPGPRTWKGAEVGMTWGEVQELHPDAEVMAKDGSGGQFYAAEIRNAQNMLLFFATEDVNEDNMYGGTLMTHGDWSDDEEIRSMAVETASSGVYGGC